jgi:arsenate reductase-like glutaredoxin family protein
MAIIIKPNKKQEKEIKAFLEEHNIGYESVAMEDAAIYKTKSQKALTTKEKKILDNLTESVEFIKKYKKGKVKAKSINQLLNEL